MQHWKGTEEDLRSLQQTSESKKQWSYYYQYTADSRAAARGTLDGKQSRLGLHKSIVIHPSAEQGAHTHLPRHTQTSPASPVGKRSLAYME